MRKFQNFRAPFFIGFAIFSGLIFSGRGGSAQSLDLKPPEAAPVSPIEPETPVGPDSEKKEASEEMNFETLIIQEVKIQGIQNIKESLVRSQIKTRKGEVFDSIEARSDIKRLMGLGPFSSADAAVSTITIKEKIYLSVAFQVTEKPKVKKVHILGAKKVSKGTIKDILSPARTDDSSRTDAPEGLSGRKAGEFRVEIAEGAFFDEAKLSETLAKIHDKYREKAVFDTEIEVEKKLDEKLNKIELTLKIKEGRKARVAKIELAGFESYPIKKITKTIKIKKGKPFDAKKTKTGFEKLNSLYKEEGWLDFIVTVTTRTATDEERDAVKRRWKPDELPLVLNYAAAEGRRHFLLGYGFTGFETMTEQELRKLANLPAGKVLKESALREAEMAILSAYRDRGRLFASLQIDKEWKKDPDGVILTFKIDERQLVYIANIYVEGLLKTKPHVIRREILLKEGDLFSWKRLLRSTDKIYNLGFIEDVRPDYDATPNPDYVDLIFDVKEGRPGMLTAGAGFSSVDGVVGTISLQHLNLLGRAQNMNLSTEFGKRRQSYDVTWKTPWTFDRRMSTSLSLFNTNRHLQFASDTTGFKRRSKGGSVFFAPRFEEDKWILGAGYTLQEDEIYDVLPVYKVDIPETVTRRSAINTRITRDTRDFVWDPKRGMEHTLSAEFVGGPAGGDVHFVKPTLTHSFHIPTFSIGRHTFVLSNALRWGMVKEYRTSNPVPVSDRFFVGGAETVRGYTYTGQIGPIQGGKVFGVANIEYKMPIVMEGRFTIIQFALFTDIGGAWRGTRDVNLKFGRELDKLKTGVGFGLRFKTPAFPVRLDWGWGLHHQPGESISQFYFTIGSIL
ncbi:MAG: outer membrane protein assembly factor BamA [Elusimicrobia bacterium]|nr:outer membrane protein assembly factor BamA [Elusimicrobiota bacterium]